MNPDTCARRREKLRAAVRRRGLDALLVSAAPNRYYLSGFELHDPQFNESAGRLVVCADGRDWLATDARYTDAAAPIWDEDRIFIYKGDGVADLARLLRSCGLRVGFEADSVSHGFVRALRRAAPGLGLEAADGLVEELRVVKDSEEIAALQASFRLNHALLDRARDFLLPGRSEQEISWDIERYFRENGASELAFANIVATGPNAALPHAVPGTDRLGENGLVLLDIGCRVQDYCSDQTRTLWVGDAPTDEFQRALDLVQKAQKAAIAVLRPGLPMRDAYAAARRVFEDAGVEKRFTHGLGHGVGLETHEAPSLNPRRADPLRAGMVVTVEPGLYYPQWGGVRWEHTALITEDGATLF